MSSEFAALIGPSDALCSGVPRHLRGTGAALNAFLVVLTFLATKHEIETVVISKLPGSASCKADRQTLVIDQIRATSTQHAPKSPLHHSRLSVQCRNSGSVLPGGGGDNRHVGW